MTLNPIYIESQEKALKNQCLLLHLGCNLSLILGLGVLTLPPFLSNNRVIRISCLTGSFLLGCNLVLISSQLQIVNKKAKALEKAVQENFGLDLVTNQIIIQDNLKARLLPIPVPVETCDSDNQYILDHSQNPEISELVESNQHYLEIEESQYDNVLVALEQGENDSVIIQDILGCKGRKYQQGKAILAEIKEQSGYK